MADDVKLCKDCKHYLPEYKGCGSVGNAVLNYITGETDGMRNTITFLRSVGGCGHSALWFEPKAAA